MVNFKPWDSHEQCQFDFTMSCVATQGQKLTSSTWTRLKLEQTPIVVTIWTVYGHWIKTKELCSFEVVEALKLRNYTKFWINQITRFFFEKTVYFSKFPRADHFRLWFFIGPRLVLSFIFRLICCLEAVSS